MLRAIKLGIGANGQGQGIEGMIQRTKRRALGHFALFRSRRVLALGKSVNLVIKEQDVYIKIPAQQVDGVIAANRKTIAITRYNPYA